MSAFHLTGIFGNSGENSNGTVPPGGLFSEKKVIPFEVFRFSRFYRCTVPFSGEFSPVESALSVFPYSKDCLLQQEPVQLSFTERNPWP